MRLIEKEGVPAPAPIEQRWTSSSSANMSPAHDPVSPDTVRPMLPHRLPTCWPALHKVEWSPYHSDVLTSTFIPGRRWLFVKAVATTLFVACRANLYVLCVIRSQLFSWVGVIMYLPLDDTNARERVTDAFLAYRDLCKTQLWDRCVVSPISCPSCLTTTYVVHGHVWYRR